MAKKKTVPLENIQPFDLKDAFDARFEELAYRKTDIEQVEQLIDIAMADHGSVTADLGDTTRYKDLVESLHAFAKEHIAPESGQARHHFGKFPHIKNSPLSRVEDALLEIAIRAAMISPAWFECVKRWTEKLVVALNKIADASPEIQQKVSPRTGSWPALLTPSSIV